MLTPYSKPAQFISHYLKHYKILLFIGILFVIATVFFQLFSPWILRYTIDFIQNTKVEQTNSIYKTILSVLGPELSKSPIYKIIGFSTLLVFITILGGIARFFMRFVLIGVSRKIEVEIRNDYFSHLLSLTPSFYDQQQTGDLMAKATNDLDAVRSMLGPGIMHLFSTVLVATSAVFLMFKISTYLTLWAIIPLPIVAIIVNRLLSKIHKLFGKIQSQFSTITAKVEENVTGIRVIKSYLQEKNEISNFKKLNKELVKRNLALAKVRALLRTNIEFILGFGTIIVIWIGGNLVIEQKLTIGGLIAFIVYFAMLAWPMIALGWVLNLWQQGLASLKRMLVIWNEKPEMGDTDISKETFGPLEGEIEFKNLSFAYDTAAGQVLSNINLKIKKGETVAIVGPTGSGKSTLVNLITRLYKAPANTLFIDGKDIENIPIKQLRQNIGFVQQESFLFSDTIKENICFGAKNKTDDEINEAAQISQLLLDFDQFPEKLETIVGERGITLSGGQKQRTSIARAVILKPTILILDDALSSVDTFTEEEILTKLRKVLLNKTCLIVSHRISTIRDADKIIVLQDGKILESGTHEKLLLQKGLYYEMHEQQQLETSLEQID